jgi:hypothetical protein
MPALAARTLIGCLVSHRLVMGALIVKKCSVAAESAATE